MGRLQTLKEAAAADAISRREGVRNSRRRMDTFYLDHPNKAKQRRRIGDGPEVTVDSLQDA